MATEHPTDAGSTDCHVALLLAMTDFSLQSALVLLQKVSKTTVIASQCAHWRGNPFPSLRSNVSAHQADNVTLVIDNFPE